MTEENQYDEIFTALKHPVRRQILLFIDAKGEASFTEIQQETSINDTGLMSYHLKGLAALVEQSKAPYRLQLMIDTIILKPLRAAFFTHCFSPLYVRFSQF
ncbi:MAG: ArsR/SmtB family transcription factor [Candidatus Bathyarchaeia archaeon]